MTKQQQINELELKVKELELKLETEELSRKSHLAELERHQKKIILQTDTIVNLHTEAYELKKYKTENSLLQIARLEAVKMLFGFMGNDASTHRQKEMFSNQAKTVITKEIDQLRLDLRYSFTNTSNRIPDSDNLPF